MTGMRWTAARWMSRTALAAVIGTRSVASAKTANAFVGAV